MVSESEKICVTIPRVHAPREEWVGKQNTGTNELDIGWLTAVASGNPITLQMKVTQASIKILTPPNLAWVFWKWSIEKIFQTDVVFNYKNWSEPFSRKMGTFQTKFHTNCHFSGIIWVFSSEPKLSFLLSHLSDLIPVFKPDFVCFKKVSDKLI